MSPRQGHPKAAIKDASAREQGTHQSRRSKEHLGQPQTPPMDLREHGPFRDMAFPFPVRLLCSGPDTPEPNSGGQDRANVAVSGALPSPIPKVPGVSQSEDISLTLGRVGSTGRNGALGSPAAGRALACPYLRQGQRQERRVRLLQTSRGSVTYRQERRLPRRCQGRGRREHIPRLLPLLLLLQWWWWWRLRCPGCRPFPFLCCR